MDTKAEKKLFEKLDAVIKLLSLNLAYSLGADVTLTERARVLKKLAGLDNRTIAEVLGTTPQTISVLTARGRR